MPESYINEFKARLVKRWLDGNCPYWALNAQFHLDPNQPCKPPKKKKNA